MLRTLSRYATGVAAITGASFAWQWLSPYFGDERGLITTFVIAVALTTAVGRWGPGLLALALGAAVIDVVFTEPRWQLNMEHSRDYLQLFLFGAGGSLMVFVIEALHRSRARVASQASVVSESERRYRMLFETSSEGILITDNDGRIIGLNDALLGYVKIPRQQFIGKPFIHFVAAGHGDDARTALDRLSRSGRFEGEIPLRDADGEPVEFEWRGRGQFLPGMNVFVGREIGRRKATEDRLRASEEEFRAVFETAGSGAAIVDARTGLFVRVNRRFCEMTGYSEAELLERSFSTVTHPDDREWSATEAARMLRGEEPAYEVEKRYLRKDGNVIWVRVIATLIRDAAGRPHRAIGIVQDITERREAEDALLQANQRLAAMIQATPLAVLAVNTDGRVIMWNPASEGIFGWSASEVLGQFLPAVPDDQRDEFLQLMDRTLSNESIAAVEVQQRRKDGRLFDASIWTAPIHDGGGRSVGILAVVDDVTERKRAHERVRESEERLSIALSAGHLGAWEWDIQSNQVNWSSGLELIHGLEEDTFPGTFEAFERDIHPADHDLVMNRIARTLHQDEPYFIQYRIRTPDRQIRWVESSGRLERAEDGTPRRMIGICADITDRKRAEIVLSSRLSEIESVYELSAAVARAESLEHVYAAALDSIERSLGTDRASILLFDADGLLRFRAWRGISESYRAAVEGHSPWAVDQKNPQPITIRDVEAVEIDADLRAVVLEEGIRALAFIPLVSSGSLLGKFMLYRNEPHEFASDELHLAATIAGHIAFAIERRAAEEALRDSEQRFRNMADNAPVMIWVTDAQGACTYLSRSWYEFTGQAAETELGSGWLEAAHPDDRAMARNAFDDASVERRAFRIEYRMRRSDGEYRWVIDAAAPRLGSDGRFLGYVGSLIDISERKRTEMLLDAQRKSLEMVVGGAPLGEVLTQLALTVERQSEGRTTASILLLDEDGCLRNGASPSLPREFLREIDGLRAAADLGTCGVAATTGRTVITPDIASAPTWKSIKHLPLDLGFRAAWSKPITARDGRVIGTFGTYFKECREPTRHERQSVEILARTAALAIERKAAVDALRESEQRFRQLAENIREVFYLADVRERKFVYVSNAFNEIWGRPVEDLYAAPQSFLEPILQEDRPAVLKSLERQRRGEVTIEEYRIVRSDGSIRWIHDRAFPVREPDGKVVRVAGVAEDITDRKQNEAHQQLLLAELSHRVKNTLASVQSIASQTLRSTEDTEAFIAAFTGRLHALARAHGLLTTSDWRTTELRAVVESALEPFRGGSADDFRLEGERVALSPKQALALALVLHELATNAAKYGALSTPTGAVSICWSCDEIDPATEQATLRLVWTESGGPPVDEPARRGFGSNLIERGIEFELDGRAVIEYRAEGIHCEITVPLPRKKARTLVHA